jgi:hypothetical protein
MKKYTITDQEWENVIGKIRELENKNQKLTGVIKGMEKAFSLTDVSQQRELLEDYTQFLWTQHNNLTNADNNKLALEKFIDSNCG